MNAIGTNFDTCKAKQLFAENQFSLLVNKCYNDDKSSWPLKQVLKFDLPKICQALSFMKHDYW